MTALVWGAPGERLYESGVDRGVLYPPNSPGVVWNGLISVTERVSGNEGSPVYFDGVKFANVLALGEFSASVKAFSYPDEFRELEGVLSVGNGLYVTNQQLTRFGMTYRTRIGNDEEGYDHGYRIHVLYNLTAVPAEKVFRTLSNDNNPLEFEWTVTAIPEPTDEFRPTAHLIFDTREMSPDLVRDVEETLYGTALDEPRLPPLATLTSFIDEWVIIRITDNFDGTYTIEAPDNLLTMLDATTFQLIQANAVFIDANTFNISSLTY